VEFEDFINLVKNNTLKGKNENDEAILESNIRKINDSINLYKNQIEEIENNIILSKDSYVELSEINRENEKRRLEKIIEESRYELDKFYSLRDRVIKQKKIIGMINFISFIPIFFLFIFVISNSLFVKIALRSFYIDEYKAYIIIYSLLFLFSMFLYSNIYLRYGFFVVRKFRAVSIVVGNNKFYFPDDLKRRTRIDRKFDSDSFDEWKNVSLENDKNSEYIDDILIKKDRNIFEFSNKSKLEKEFILNEYGDIFSSSRDRILKEIKRLTDSGIYNLTIGAVTTILSVIVLGFVVFIQKEPDDINHIQYISTIVMRLSIAVFIEVFAYFFLRLYKKNLDEIRFFQNEISNLDYKWAALAVSAGNDDLIKISVENLISTERNYLLKPGETTIELEREKMEKNEILEIVKDVASIMKIRDEKSLKNKK